MKCTDCPNRGFFKFLTGNKEDIPLCPICYLKRFEEKLQSLPLGLNKIKKNLKIKDGYAEFFIPGKEKPVWSGHE